MVHVPLSYLLSHFLIQKKEAKASPLINSDSCPVSVYCDLVRWKVCSATSISEWQHVKVSEKIRP